MACRVALLTALVMLACVVHETTANPQKGQHFKKERTGNQQRENMRLLSSSNHNFTVALFREISKQEGNVFFSPFSIHTVLSMTSIGARGITEQQMRRAMSLPIDTAITKKSYKAIFKNLDKTGDSNVTLKSANKIYMNSDYPLNEKFKFVTGDSFNSDVVRADFSKDAPGVRNEINAWVEENTNHKIMDLIAEGSLNAQTMMVLVNAIYFKGQWATTFDEADTTPKPFHKNRDEKVNVPMMYVRSDFSYKEFDDLDAKVLELSYAGDKLSMLIILPNKVDGLAALESQLTVGGSEKLQSILQTNSYDRLEVNVWLPKFKMEQSIDLKDVLIQLGMTSMFDNTANFSGMLESSQGQKLKVSKVAHKAFIEVNEEGSEAAAATSVNLIQRMAIISEKVNFTANHPFIFLIHHRPSKAVMFMGRLSLP